MEIVLWIGSNIASQRWARVRDVLITQRRLADPSVQEIASAFFRMFRSVLFAAETAGGRRPSSREIGRATFKNRITGLRGFLTLVEKEEIAVGELDDCALCAVAHTLAGAPRSRYRRILAGMRWGERVFELGLSPTLDDPAVDAAWSGIALAGPVAARGSTVAWPDKLVLRVEAIAAGRVEMFASPGFGLIAGALLTPGFGGVRWMEGRYTFSVLPVPAGFIAGAQRSKTVDVPVVYPVLDFPLDVKSAWVKRYLGLVSEVMGGSGFRVFPAPRDPARLSLLADPALWTSYFDGSDSGPGASWLVATRWLRTFLFAAIQEFPIDATVFQGRLPAPHGLRAWLTSALSALGESDPQIARVMHWRTGGPVPVPTTIRTYDRAAIGSEIRAKRRIFRQFQLGWRSPDPGALPEVPVHDPLAHDPFALPGPNRPDPSADSDIGDDISVGSASSVHDTDESASVFSESSDDDSGSYDSERVGVRDTFAA